MTGAVQRGLTETPAGSLILILFLLAVILGTAVKVVRTLRDYELEDVYVQSYAPAKDYRHPDWPA